MQEKVQNQKAKQRWEGTGEKAQEDQSQGAQKPAGVTDQG